MTNADVEKLFDQTFSQILKLRRLKSCEYSDDDDALANFRRNEKALDLPMTTVWHVYASKHWDAVSNFIKDVYHNRKRVLTEPIEGRIDDLIIYLILLKAIVREAEVVV